MDQQSAILATLIFYKLALVAIGVWAARRVKGEDDFFLGGRRVGALVSGLSYAASTSSAWVLLGFSGFVFVNGLSALWMVPGIWAGYAVMWLWVGPKLRRESADHGLVTLTDYLVLHVTGNWKRIIILMCTLMIVFCFIFYIAAQFDAAAKAFVDQFQLSHAEAVWIGAIIILVYCLLGGFWAVSVTDALQAFVMVLLAILLPALVLVQAGGIGDVIGQLEQSLPGQYLDIFGGMGLMVFIGFVLGLWGIGLGPLGQPHLLSRLMAVESDAARRRGFLIAMGWGVLVYCGMAVLALGGRALVESGQIPVLASGESIFYAAAAHSLPPVLAGIVIAATLSAVMSTVDSILLSAAAAVAHDMGLTRRYPKLAVTLARIVMVGIGLMAVVLTLTLSDTIFNRVLFAWSALGAAFGPVVVAQIAGRQPSGLRIAGAIFLGFTMTVVFYSFGSMTPQTQSGLVPFLVELARLPGDPFERVVPWILPLVLVLTGENRPGADD